MERRKLRGLKLESNDAAYELEQTLGVDFPDKPSFALFSLRNRAALLLNAATINRDPALVALQLTNHWFGIYSSEYHIYLSRRPRKYCELHENAHGYANTVNTELFRTIQGVNDALSGTAPFDVEKHVVAKTFIEGSAQWAAIYTAAQSKDLHTNEAAVEEFNRMYDIYGRRSRAKPNKYPIAELQRLKRTVIDLTQVDEETGKNKSVAQQVGRLHNMRESLYVVGHEFMRKGMNYLLDEGAEVGVAFEAFHMNPPP